ncbi:MAG: ABC transporter ATP-binding protein [Dehalococcoidia bacterium]
MNGKGAMDPAASVLMRAEGLTRRFGGVTAVNGVSFELGSREILGIIGPNGAGKSTLLALLGGELKPTSGLVYFRNHDVTERRSFARCREGLARTFQIPRPFPELTVIQNVIVGAHYGASTGAWVVDEILELCGLTSQALTKSGDLTHSDQRRLELARALATGPEVVLLDEVGAGLSQEEIDQFAELVEELRLRGLSLVVVEHVMSFVMRVSDRLLVIDEGNTIAYGIPQDVVRHPAVIDAYLGGAV